MQENGGSIWEQQVVDFAWYKTLPEEYKMSRIGGEDFASMEWLVKRLKSSKSSGENASLRHEIVQKNNTSMFLDTCKIKPKLEKKNSLVYIWYTLVFLRFRTNTWWQNYMINSVGLKIWAPRYSPNDVSTLKLIHHENQFLK